MLAYDKTLLLNIAIVKKAKYWYANKLISNQQMVSILNDFKTEYYKPNLFVKIGLFLFCIFIVLATLGLITLVFSPFFQYSNSDIIPVVICVVMFAGCIAAAELLIRAKSLYKTGITEALVYSAVCFLFSIFAFSFNDQNEEQFFLNIFLIMLPVLLYGIARYADRVLTIAFVFCFFTVYFLLLLKLGEIAKLIMPFALMALSAGLYFFTKIEYKKSAMFYYKQCIKTAQFLSLIIFYVAGNYFVIRESSVEMFNLHLQPGENIPLAFLFYLFTALVPLVYLFYGLRIKDKLHIWTALLLIAVSALTFKYYFSLGHPEVSLTIAGLVLTFLAYLSIRYLKTDKHGITFKEEQDEDNFLKTNAEALAIAQGFVSQQQVQQQQTQFGGGDFGGAGSGSKF
nr:hypothetical protein [Bacteroidia bacterium]